MANWANVQRLGDPLSAGWQDQNLAWIEPVPGQRWQVHKHAAPAFEGLLRDLAATGYKPTSSGGFNYRNVRGGDRLSQHAFGTAIDINAAANPMLSRGASVVTDLPANTAEIARKYGLEWGGNWKRPDAMHFEWMGGDVPAPAGGTMMASAAPAAAGAPSPLAAMFSSPGAPPAPGGPPVASQGIGNIALMFAQQQARRQQQRADEEAADQARRNALFGADSLAGLYG